MCTVGGGEGRARKDLCPEVPLSHPLWEEPLPCQPRLIYFIQNNSYRVPAVGPAAFTASGMNHCGQGRLPALIRPLT